jgi:hypothetical protein
MSLDCAYVINIENDVSSKHVTQHLVMKKMIGLMNIQECGRICHGLGLFSWTEERDLKRKNGKLLPLNRVSQLSIKRIVLS